MLTVIIVIRLIHLKLSKKTCSYPKDTVLCIMIVVVPFVHAVVHSVLNLNMSVVDDDIGKGRKFDRPSVSRI